MKKSMVFSAAFVLASCANMGGGGETYRSLLIKLCAAPPNIMQSVLTTPQLQLAWTTICAHANEIYPQAVQ